MEEYNTRNVTSVCIAARGRESGYHCLFTYWFACCIIIERQQLKPCLDTNIVGWPRQGERIVL